MIASEDNLIWIDLEMTGLDPEQDRIIEIATVITDTNLEIIAEGPVLAINQSEECLASMGEWCTKQHAHSGLTERVKESTIDESSAENNTLEFIKQYVPENKSPMCGNSICMDRRFLYRYMPRFESYFHYRNLDVSSLKILAQRWAPEVAVGITKVSEHRALQDIRDSIEELRYYRKHLFKS